MSSSAAFQGKYYTLERDVRELQQIIISAVARIHYTLERDVRELQPHPRHAVLVLHYTLERDVRELQQIAGLTGG